MARVNDIIVAVGAMDDLDLVRLSPKIRLVDATGCVVMLGLVFGGNRAHEVERKPRGESCLDILAGGGGILSTMRARPRIHR